ncbi:MAG TPA: DUF72 domain-containing protein [Pedobacter sp.]|jgi:uncharacterized protein YecE (DUF72 family)
MAKVIKREIYSGASGLVLPVKNKLSYPPDFQDKSRLEYYSSLFNSIEINSSFYKLPMASTIAKWAACVPDYFKFTFKLWRDITHNKGLVFNPDDVLKFLERIAPAKTNKGCLLVQFPPSLTVFAAAQLEGLLGVIKEANVRQEWKVAIEFRNKSWYEDEIFQLVEEYNSTIVLHDIPASATPLPDEVSDFVYLRFHGPNGGYRGSYPDDFLYEYAQYINDWNESGKSVYVYFNNTMGDAVHNLITLNKFMAED